MTTKGRLMLEELLASYQEDIKILEQLYYIPMEELSEYLVHKSDVVRRNARWRLEELQKKKKVKRKMVVEKTLIYSICSLVSLIIMLLVWKLMWQ